MKSLKAAAVVTGSVVLAGAATPASAFDPSEVAPMSLNGAWNQLMSEPIDISPLKQQSNMLDTENKDSLLSSVKSATTALNAAGSPLRLLGGLPLGR
ncbi:hypothetical protein [Streptomyces poonensis]|uniref:Secreted protein n=1 Tax=Streptomyces poonensis TaxID=68255 RepID=A0A918UL41_9ACTN|nr:hypothetical protein [Streptomyces poonensis]GGZ17863.1 hypothetical protein GCM10010365_42380 [Streptomyces poonensis]GLJ91019.1 hypothetical protein GCM10017589_36250 [Streptomyces poonensis]